MDSVGAGDPGAVDSDGEGTHLGADPAIPTYAFPPADVTPRFYDGDVTQGAEARVYPYPMWDVLGSEKVDQEYTLV